MSDHTLFPSRYSPSRGKPRTAIPNIALVLGLTRVQIVGHEDAYTSHIKVKPSTPLRKVFAGWAELHKLNWRDYRYVLRSSPSTQQHRRVLAHSTPTSSFTHINCRFMYDGIRLQPDDGKVSFLPLTHPSVFPQDSETLDDWILR